MAASGPARPKVARRLAAAVTVVGLTLSGFLLGGPVAATGTTAAPAGIGVRSAPGPVHQVNPVVRDSDVRAATVAGTVQVVPAGAGAAAPAQQTAALRVPEPVFVGQATDRGGRVRGVDVDGVRGRAPPVRRAPAVH